MEDFEQKLLTKFPELKFWVRYVDDVFALHKLTDRELDLILKKMNSINKRIQFTCEKESNRQLPFLDILIDGSTEKFTFDIYRKPTFCPHFIDTTSFHPSKQKLSFLYSSQHLQNFQL